MNQKRHNQGFTLLEVMLALALLVMISGSVFSLVKSSLESAVITETRVRNNDSKYGFLELFRRVFRGLPEGVVLYSNDAQDDELQGNILIFFGAFPVLSWGDVVIHPSDYYMIGYLAEKKEIALKRSSGEDGSESEWLPLIENVEGVTWRFYDGVEKKWLEVFDWDQPRPAVIELTMKLEYEASPTRSVFWLPTLLEPQVAA